MLCPRKFFVPANFSRGRSQNLTVNYRTSHQIRGQADRLLPGSIFDVNENTEARGGTITIFNGLKPSVKTCEDRIGSATDTSELEEVTNTERHLLCVAWTRVVCAV